MIQQITRIHPFDNGNGRVARLFMNLILKRFGLQPVYFFSEKEYLKAVDEGHNNDQAFAEFLKGKVSSFTNLRILTADWNVPDRNQFIAQAGAFTVPLPAGLVRMLTQDDSASLV